MFKQMANATKNIVKKAWQLAYFMRGSLQYERALMLTFIEREVGEDFIADRLKIESEKPYPNY